MAPLCWIVVSRMAEFFSRVCPCGANLSICAMLIVLAILDSTGGANAETRIVALGASNTAGYGVSGDQAYPAQLEAMLRARGKDVRVTNAGVSGDTSAGMLGRLGSAVPDGTRIVILDPGNNDIKACTEPWRPQRCATPARRAGNISAIAARLRARGIRVVMAKIEFRLIPLAQWQADRRHLTPEGHRIIASRLASQIAPVVDGGGRR
jgi:acyl-CoA thioesterase I